MEGARVIWVLFGDISRRSGRPAIEYANRVRDAYSRHKSTLEHNGYTLGFASGYTSKNAFLNLIADDCSWAMIWHSHGNREGQLSDANGTRIYPSDVRKVSANLRFAALWGCDVQQNAEAWLSALTFRKRFPTDARKRLAAHYASIEADDINLGTLSLQPPSITFITNAGKFFPYYTFPQWIELLPKTIGA